MVKVTIASKTKKSWIVKLQQSNKLLWGLQIVLALLFIFAGFMKLVTPVAEMTKDMAFPGWFLRFLGVAELLGGLGLVLPGLLKTHRQLTSFAALGLLVIMIGAVVTVLLSGQLGMAIVPLVTGVLCALVALGRKPWQAKIVNG